MATVSRDTPCYYITAVCKDRLPVFRADAFKELACRAIDEARTSGKFALFAYVIMPDHIHLITDSARKASDTLRFIKGISSHRIIEYLKEQGYESSLEKLRHEERERNYKYSAWDQESNVLLLTSESFFMQKINYIHLNPMRAGLVERATDCRWSSARFWARCQRDDEPLKVDIDRIVWRKKR
ncbi:MAG: transposase [Acidobacteriota bacterium]